MDYLKEIPEYGKLTLRRQMFVRNLLLDPKRNAAKAARNSGYSEKNSNKMGTDLTRDPKIRVVLDKYDSMVASDHERLRLRIVAELCIIAFSDVKSFLSWAKDAYHFKSSEDLPSEVSRAISEISESITMAGSNKKIKLHDKMSALKELNKMHGFHKPVRHDLTSSDGSVSGNQSTVILLPKNGREKEE